MDPSLMHPAELELRGLIIVHTDPDAPHYRPEDAARVLELRLILHAYNPDVFDDPTRPA